MLCKKMREGEPARNPEDLPALHEVDDQLNETGKLTKCLYLPELFESLLLIPTTGIQLGPIRRDCSQKFTCEQKNVRYLMLT